MAQFIRATSSQWHEVIPGTRWFRADLHLHTLDDAIGGNISWQVPASIVTPIDPYDIKTRAAYALCFLKAAASAGIEVLGLTPHSAHIPDNNNLSTVWDIIEAWQKENDDDGIPFREKIYAVFPGFEPSVAEGKGGIHLIVLFDPEISKDQYLNAFAISTGGQNVWKDGRHQTSTRDAKALLDGLYELKQREGNAWDYLCIAPHAFSDKGVVDSLKGDLGKYFAFNNIAALEMKDNDVPEEVISSHEYIKDHLQKYCQPLIYGSDAYGLRSGGIVGQVPVVDSPQKRGIGYRYILVKLASPRIESLRQAFLSSDSRLRLVYEKQVTGQLQFRKDIPVTIDSSRPWLRSVSIDGGTSFFGGKGIKQVVRFSPDLTCIIGGRMTGKSTLLDGIRTYCRLGEPQSSDIANDMRQRAGCFLSGNPTIALDIVSPIARTLPLGEQWPAKFFTQRELANIAKDKENIRRILYHLAPAGSDELYSQDKKIAELDDKLLTLSRKIEMAHAELAEKEQAFITAEKAKQALDAFQEAGVNDLATAQADLGRAEYFAIDIKKIQEDLVEVSALLANLKAPSFSSPNTTAADDVESLLGAAMSNMVKTVADISKLVDVGRFLGESLKSRVAGQRANVQKKLVDQGRKAEELNQFDSLSMIAATHENSRVSYETVKGNVKKAEDEFVAIESERKLLVEKNRESLEKIIHDVNGSISNIRVSLARAVNRTNLDAWIRGLREPGITRWWNENTEIADPSSLYSLYASQDLASVGMSDTVIARFMESMTSARHYELRAMRSNDECRIEARVGEGAKDFRPLQKLSGGKQISVLLSLLLESIDSSPLVIDQPEDELDKAFLTNTLLPILRKLKGKRQVIFSTHDANIVVNGDADYVVFLEADADNAKVASQDAIDNISIRNAILTVLDGGKDAFDLRKRKYGF